MNWQKEVPTESGDWLYVVMWECNCCIHRDGIVWVDIDGVMHWHSGEDHPEPEDIDGWLKLDTLPTSKLG